jgi:RecT family
MTETDTRDPAFIEVRENSAREAAREMTVHASGVLIENFAQLVDLAKYMSTAGWAVRKELRNNLGACMMIIEQAQQWGFSRWQLARVCYVVNDILCYESQVIHAIVEKFAPLKGRLRVKYEGEGAERKAIISGHIKTELEPLEYESPAIGNISPKNSPLWKTDPDQQLFYLASQRWCKRYCPDVLLGIHDIDQVGDTAPHVGFDHAKDVTPKLAERVRDFKAEGFSVETSLTEIDVALAAAGVTQTTALEQKE